MPNAVAASVRRFADWPSNNQQRFENLRVGPDAVPDLRAAKTCTPRWGGLASLPASPQDRTHPSPHPSTKPMLGQCCVVGGRS